MEQEMRDGQLTLGEKIISAIIQQGMVKVAHPDPDLPNVFVWSSSAAEQIEAVVHEHIAQDLESWAFDK